MDKLTDFEKWIIDQAIAYYLSDALAELIQAEKEGRVPIITPEYLEMTVDEIYRKLRMNKGE